MMGTMGLRVVSVDDTDDNADWTKQTWDLPPYMSPEFLSVVPDVETFKRSPTYRHAVANGLIVDDEWVGDMVEGVK